VVSFEKKNRARKAELNYKNLLCIFILETIFRVLLRNFLIKNSLNFLHCFNCGKRAR